MFVSSHNLVTITIDNMSGYLSHRQDADISMFLEDTINIVPRELQKFDSLDKKWRKWGDFQFFFLVTFNLVTLKNGL